MYKGLNADSEKMWYQLSNGRTALNLVFRYLDMVTNPHKGGAKDHEKYGLFFRNPSLMMMMRIETLDDEEEDEQGDCKYIISKSYSLFHT